MQKNETKNTTAGVVRHYTLQEIADAVKNFRYCLGHKQDSLAMQAGVSKKTLERIEKTGTGSCESLGKIAIALGLDACYFSKQHYFPGEEEKLLNIQKHEALYQSYEKFNLCELNNERHLDLVLAADGYILNGDEDSKIKNLLCKLRQDLYDYSFIYNELDFKKRYEAKEYIFKNIKEIANLKFYTTYSIQIFENFRTVVIFVSKHKKKYAAINVLQCFNNCKRLFKRGLNKKRE